MCFARATDGKYTQRLIISHARRAAADSEASRERETPVRPRWATRPGAGPAPLTKDEENQT